jgi:hypothetical protein
MQSTGSPFVANEIKETEIAKPGAKVLSFEGRDLRDSVPIASDDPSQTEGYDLICIDNLVERIRNGEPRELLALLFSGLNPGGRLLVGGAAESEGQDLDVRDAETVSQLSACIPDSEIGGQTVFRNHPGGTVFLEVYRKVA